MTLQTSSIRGNTKDFPCSPVSPCHHQVNSGVAVCPDVGNPSAYEDLGPFAVFRITVSQKEAGTTINIRLNKHAELGTGVHICHLSPWKAEAGELCKV